MSMNCSDYLMAYSGSLSDRLAEKGRDVQLGGATGWRADPGRIDDLALSNGPDGHSCYQRPAYRSDREPPLPFYRPYQPEIPSLAPYERLAPPPPMAPPEPEPELPKYEDFPCMTQALFDWEMTHVKDDSNTPREGGVGSSAEVIPSGLAEIMAEMFLPAPPPPEDPWSWQ